MILGPGPSSVETFVSGTGFEENLGVDACRDIEGLVFERVGCCALLFESIAVRMGDLLLRDVAMSVMLGGLLLGLERRPESEGGLLDAP